MKTLFLCAVIATASACGSASAGFSTQDNAGASGGSPTGAKGSTSGTTGAGTSSGTTGASTSGGTAGTGSNGGSTGTLLNAMQGDLAFTVGSVAINGISHAQGGYGVLDVGIVSIDAACNRSGYVGAVYKQLELQLGSQTVMGLGAYPLYGAGGSPTSVSVFYSDVTDGGLYPDGGIDQVLTGSNVLSGAVNVTSIGSAADAGNAGPSISGTFEFMLQFPDAGPTELTGSFSSPYCP